MTDADGEVREISAANVSTYKIGYVNITHPSYPFKVKGLQPDPLLPMTLANGQRLGWQPSGGMDPTLRGVQPNTTQLFYVLFRVPNDSAPGVYKGSLKVGCTDDAGNPAPDVTIQVSLTVSPFSVAQRTLKTAFALDSRRVMLSNSLTGKWLNKNDLYGHGLSQVTETTTYHADQLNTWIRYMADHRLSSQVLSPAWTGPAANGTMSARHDVLDDYLAAGQATTFDGDRLALNAVKLPEYAPPAWIKNPFSSKAAQGQAARYYRSADSALGPYRSKAYVYPVDEPRANMRAFVEKYAKFLLTTDPTTQKNKLVKGVDIYAQRLQFFFRDASWVNKIHKARKEVWIYSHGSAWQGQVPVYLIDRSLADSRVQGWFAYRTGATGLLYWNVNSWRAAVGTAPRDPYVDPVSGLSVVGKTHIYNNGDGSLLYPGYYPRLGLNVEGAGPVGSLRMEALRDGLEDYEYVRLVRARYGAGTANAYVNRIIAPLPRPKRQTAVPRLRGLTRRVRGRARRHGGSSVPLADADGREATYGRVGPARSAKISSPASVLPAEYSAMEAKGVARSAGRGSTNLSSSPVMGCVSLSW